MITTINEKLLTSDVISRFNGQPEPDVDSDTSSDDSDSSSFWDSDYEEEDTEGEKKSSQAPEWDDEPDIPLEYQLRFREQSAKCIDILTNHLSSTCWASCSKTTYGRRQGPI
jgi:hypothetical protein